MLCQLTVRNVALIDELDLPVPPGLTVITGETGAGKSMLLDALELVLGGRAEGGLVRAGAERAVVTGRFRPPGDHPAWSWLRERELAEGDEILVRRTLLAEGGRSRAYVNETPVAISALAELGGLLMDIHGQHEHQSLLHTATHIAILDAFAGHDRLVELVVGLQREWRGQREELARLRDQVQSAAERRAFLAFQVEELDAAGVREGEWGELDARRHRLAHVNRLQEAVEQALLLLEEGEGNAEEALGRAARALEETSGLDGQLTPLAEQLRSLHYELRDTGDRLRHYREGLESDPEALLQLEERLDVIHRLCRKHRREADELPALAASWREELETIDHFEDNEGRLERELHRTALAYRQEAERLGQGRRAAAAKLTTAVEKALKGLHMAGTRFEVAFKGITGDPRPQGMEEVSFQVSTNPGEPLKPLRQVASGGEISRIMLALKGVLAHAVTVPSLVFDEVDVGVGGRVATAIGQRLAQVAATGRQVLAITHLPQVAAWGEHHLKVEKQASHDRTAVTVTTLGQEARVEELARMLAGDQITEAARHNALELLHNGRLQSNDAKGQR